MSFEADFVYDPAEGMNYWFSLPNIQWFDRHNPAEHQDHEFDVYYRVVLFPDLNSYLQVRRYLQVSTDILPIQEYMYFLRAPVCALMVGFMEKDEQEKDKELHWHSSFIVKRTEDKDPFQYMESLYGVRGVSDMLKPMLKALFNKSPLTKEENSNEISSTGSVHSS